MASQTQQQLQQLISSQARIEALLNRVLSTDAKNNKKGKQTTEKVSVSLSKDFGKVVKSLETIESEAKKTNTLLSKLIQVNSFESKEVTKEIQQTATALTKMGRGIENLVKAAQVIGKLPETAVDKFKSLLMITVFLDPQTGKPLTTEKRLQEAHRAHQSILNIAKGIALFGLTMVAFSLAVPQITKGALGFAIVVTGLITTLFFLNKVLNQGAGGLKDTSVLGSLHKLGISIATFGLTMILFGFALPQIAKGALGFMSVIAAMGLTLFTLDLVLGYGAGGLKDTSPLGTLSKLGISVATFGLTMILFGFALPQIAKGALGFITVVAAMSLALFSLDKVLRKGQSGLKDTSPLGSLKRLGISIALFALTLVLISLVIVPFSTGALAVILAITGIGLALRLMSEKRVERGIKNFRATLLPILGLAGAALVFEYVSWESLAKMSVTIIGTALAFAIAGEFEKEIQRGARALQPATIALLMISGAMLVYSIAAKKLTWESIGMLGAVIAGLTLMGILAGIPPLPGFLASGSAALITASVALITISSGLLVYSFAAKKLTWESIGMLGAVVGGLALMGTLAGIPPLPVFIMMGAAALTSAATALVVISTGLLIFSKSNWSEDDSKNLNSALRSIIAGFLGYQSLDDIGFRALIRVPMIIGFLLSSAVAMLGVSVALLPLSLGLSVFKKTQWNEEDSQNLKSTILAVTQAVTNQEIDWKSVKRGINSLQNLSRTLTGLAEGVQGFANLSFTEYELDEETGQLKPVRKIRLSSEDIQKVGVSIGHVISAVTRPLAEFGEQMTSGKSGGFLSVNWGKMIAIHTGINSLREIGRGLVNLAQGVQDWANMTVTEWGIQKDKTTGLNTLVPVNKRPIKDEEIEKAAQNIAHVLSGLIAPLRDFGEMIDGSATSGNLWQRMGWQKSGVEKGINSFKTLGEGLSNLSQGVISWAKMEIIEYTVQKDKKTGLNTLVPAGKPKLIKVTDLIRAKNNITRVLSGLVEPLQEWGDFISGNRKFGFFTSYNIIDKGIASLANVTDTLSKLAKSVADFASMNFTVYEVVKDKKSGTSSLQPKDIIYLGKNEITQAKDNLELIITTIAGVIWNFSDDLEKRGGSKKMEKTLSSIQSIYDALAEAAMIMQEKFAKIQETSITNFTKFSKALEDAVKISNFENYNQNLYYFSANLDRIDISLNKKFGEPGLNKLSVFTQNILKLAEVTTPFEKFVNAFDKMAISMGTFANNFKIMTPEGIEAFSLWTNTLVKAIEVGKEAQKGAYDSFIKTSENSLDSAFQFGKNQLGSGKPATTTSERKSIIDETLKHQEQKNPQEAQLLKVLQALQEEIFGLKQALRSTLDVNISGVDAGVKIGTYPKG